MLLVDMGADVIKIEDPNGGDYARWMGVKDDGKSNIFAMNNRGKRSLILNLKDERGQAVLKKLVEKADVLIESFRLGTPVIARRLGPFPEIVERAGAGALFEAEGDLIAAMQMVQADPARRAALSKAARTAFEMHWREDRVMAAYGAAFARAAHRRGDRTLAARLEAGAFEGR